MDEDVDLLSSEEGVVSTFHSSMDKQPLILLNALTGMNTYRTMRIRGCVGENALHVLADSGSTHNFLDLQVAKKLGCRLRKICPLEVSVANGNVMFITYECKGFTWVFQGITYSTDVMILPLGGCDIVLGNQWHPPNQKDAVELMVKELLDSGVIRNNQSSFSYPIIMVKKKYGTWRMCVDYKQLNKYTVKYKFPILVIKELINELHWSKVFSKLDFRSGYHQIRMNEHDIHKTAFRTHEGHYEFLVMPFGLTNAPSTFQSLMNSVFKEFLRKFVLVFFDDILVYRKILQEHVDHLHQVLAVMEQQSLFAKLSKCTFATTSVDYLGHTIFDKGVSTDKNKIQAMQDWPNPKTLKQLRGFLGLTGYYRKFIKNYALVSHPLTALLRKNAFQWNEDAQRSFTALKQATIQALVLALPDFHKTFIVETYASGQRLTTPFQTKWLPKLLGYDYEISYKKGSENTTANAFSRVLGGTELNSLVLTSITSDLVQKPNLAAYPGYIQPLPIPDKIWSSISMDFIEGLPSSQQRCVIMVLDLPAHSQVHHVFHVSQLKICKGSSNKMGMLHHCGPTRLISVEPIAILDRKLVKVNNKVAVYVLVKWSNHTDEDATWELYSDLLQRFPDFKEHS
ncbi:putative mitochondrial protein, partial [Tanacetum coccineum]